MFEFYINFADGFSKKAKCKVDPFASYEDYSLDEEIDYKQVASIDVLLTPQPIPAGDDGYFLLPGGHGRNDLKESAIGYFTPRKDTYYHNIDTFMSLAGICHGTEAFLAVVTALWQNSSQILEIKDGKYKITLRVPIDFEKPYTQLCVRKFYIPKEDMSYSAMARIYRKYKLEECGFRRLSDKLTDEVKYSAEAVYVRIRHCWKPVPCTVLEQTVENEPSLHVACTFADAEKIILAYKRAGIKKAEFCLVGWNIRGHDGRWPQILPPEEALGGEKGLKKLIATAKECGYLITCHTNSTDAYTIAENFSFDDIAKNADGSYSIEAERWAGGRTYNICPKRAYEISLETLSDVAELGFRGLHYIDVITCTKPRKCSSPDHPVNYGEAEEYFDKLFAFCREKFGGAFCESSFECGLRNVDSVLYTTFRAKDEKLDFVDRYVPFWQLVYHGIVISNPYSTTVNCSLDDELLNHDMLKLIEMGGRPVVYYYSKFVTDNTHWMGERDFTAANDEILEKEAFLVKRQSELYEKLSYLQYHFMESHEMLSEDVYRVTYSDGSVVTVDYNKGEYDLKKGEGNV